ncbi:MAG: hypothetical protein HYZ81_05625 [Nitrospinae bacterium]|nr:hypothetical protein [Nitrospinota bacterium]
MLHVPDPLSQRAHGWRDVGTLTLVAAVCVPVYLLLNEYWQSVFRLLVLYGLLGLFCLRLGEYLHRAMRRLPAEIPPWQGDASVEPVTPWLEQRFGAAEAIRSARWDPHYVQNVLKPRLQRLLVYRLSATLDMPPEALDALPLGEVEPPLLDFLRRQEPTGLWARCRYRRQRIQDVLETLRRLEAL